MSSDAELDEFVKLQLLALHHTLAMVLGAYQPQGAQCRTMRATVDALAEA